MKKISALLCFLLCFWLIACSQNQRPDSSEQSHPSAEATDTANATVAEEEKLGTKWGDDISSHTESVSLVRLSETPIAQSQVRYADKQYQGQSINSISLGVGQISFSIVDEQGQALPLYRSGQNYYLAAKDGQSYQLKYNNQSGNTYEVVASVDGIDVIRGSAASKQNGGYILYPNDSLIIEGFRKSDSAVASFTFSRPEQAYAANSSQGSIANTGIIGTVIYQVESPEVAAAQKKESEFAPAPNAFPADR